MLQLQLTPVVQNNGKKRFNNSYVTQQVFVNFVRREKRIKSVPHIRVLTPVLEFQSSRDAYPYFPWVPQPLEDALRSFETSANTNRETRRHIPDLNAVCSYKQFQTCSFVCRYRKTSAVSKCTCQK